MTEEDEKRLVDMLLEIWMGDEGMRDGLLLIAKAAREFREEGELRCGDEVQVSDLISTVGRVTYIGPTPYGNHIVDTQNSGLIHVDNVKIKPKTERRLLDQVALMQWFTDHDWRPDCDGVYRAIDCLHGFLPKMWQYCGMPVDEMGQNFAINNDWIVEVEVASNVTIN